MRGYCKNGCHFVLWGNSKRAKICEGCGFVDSSDTLNVQEVKDYYQGQETLPVKIHDGNAKPYYVSQVDRSQKNLELHLAENPSRRCTVQDVVNTGHRGGSEKKVVVRNGPCVVYIESLEIKDGFAVFNFA